MSEELKQTDRSRYLRNLAGDGCDFILSRASVIATAQEIERYYGGMLNWKATAEAKDAAQLAASAVPTGYKLVPIEPTESMVVDGFESAPSMGFSKPEDWDAFEEMSGCHQAAHKARLCYAAMLAAAPETWKVLPSSPAPTGELKQAAVSPNTSHNEGAAS
jgi:hypothetical protein